jgi:hypothetical protein
MRSFDMSEDTYPRKQRDWRVSGSDTDQMIRDNELKQHAEDWDFDPKFRTGSISEETPDEKRRKVFYNENFCEILSVYNSYVSGLMDYDNIIVSRSMNRAALVVSELLKRCGEENRLKIGDPEFNGATHIDQV